MSHPSEAAVARWAWVGIALSILLMGLYRGYAGDDTFIHMQYARNLAAGEGFSFNPGEPSYGSTSPLWTLLLAVTGSLTGGRYLLAAKVTSALFALLTLVAFRRLAARSVPDPTLAAVAVTVLALDPWFLKWGASGMETSAALFVTVMALSVSRLSVAAFWLGVGTLLRPELLGLFLVLVADRLIVRGERREILPACLFYLLPILPWLFYAASAFGHIVPNTVHAKSGALTRGDVLVRTLKIYGATYAPLLVAALFALRAIVGRASGWRETAPFWGWAVGLPVAYFVTRSYVASRYLLPAIPALALVATWGLARGTTRVKRNGTILLVTMLAASAIVQATVIHPRTRFTQGVDDNLIAVAEWVRTNTPPEAVIALHEVGAVGYHCERRVIDTAGLVTPDALPYVQEYRVPDLLRERKPDYYVSSGDERTDRQVMEAFGGSMERLFERPVQRGGSSSQFAEPLDVAVYRFVWE